MTRRFTPTQQKRGAGGVLTEINKEKGGTKTRDFYVWFTLAAMKWEQIPLHILKWLIDTESWPYHFTVKLAWHRLLGFLLSMDGNEAATLDLAWSQPIHRLPKSLQFLPNAILLMCRILHWNLNVFIFAALSFFVTFAHAHIFRINVLLFKSLWHLEINFKRFLKILKLKKNCFSQGGLWNNFLQISPDKTGSAISF